MTDQTLSNMLSARGTSEWHMARNQEAILHMWGQRQEILRRKASEIQEAVSQIEAKYEQEIQQWEQEYHFYMTLNMPSGA